MIRILIAEDSSAARALLSEILASDSEIQIVGVATNGTEAVELTQRLHPDVVTIDIHMPHMDGLLATKEIMITAPTPIVIVTASHSSRDVEVSMNALRAGALDVLDKPRGPGSKGFEEASRKLISTLKAMANVKVVRHIRPGINEGSARPPVVRKSVVAIAVSTGGPAALQRVFERIPADYPLPVLVVQHISAGFVPGLVKWLNLVSNLTVKVADDGEALKPRTVYFAPDNHHLTVSNQRRIQLLTSSPRGGFRPSGNVLFESVARVYGSEALAVIMTGMGEDGVEGLQAVRKAGGHIIAQDEKSSVVFGMPHAAIAAGLVDQVVALDDIASHFVALA